MAGITQITAPPAAILGMPINDAISSSPFTERASVPSSAIIQNAERVLRVIRGGWLAVPSWLASFHGHTAVRTDRSQPAHGAKGTQAGVHDLIKMPASPSVSLRGRAGFFGFARASERSHRAASVNSWLLSPPDDPAFPVAVRNRIPSPRQRVRFRSRRLVATRIEVSPGGHASDIGQYRKPSRQPSTLFGLLEVQPNSHGDSLFSRDGAGLPQDTSKNRKDGTIGSGSIRIRPTTQHPDPFPE